MASVEVNDKAVEEVEVSEKKEETNVDTTQQTNGVEGDQQAPPEEFQAFPIYVLTFDKQKIQLQVSKIDTVMDVKQYLFEAKEICYVTSYHLEFNGTKLSDYVELSTIEGLEKDSQLQMIEAPYDDRTARIHVRRLRDLLFSSAFNTPGSPSLYSHFASAAGLDESIDELPQKSKHSTPKAKDVESIIQKLNVAEIGSSKLSDFYPASFGNQAVQQCVKSITFSGWNPPPGNRKLLGDLFYLEISTFEGKTVYVTASVNGFFINSSTNIHFNPSPASPSCYSHTLVGLLQNLSATFKKNFPKQIKYHFEKHPFEVLPVPTPVYPWLEKTRKHTFDLNRAEDSLLMTSDSDPIRGQLRDWNEEYQGCKELPHSTLQDRILRDRALVKVTYDFVEVATRGAVAIVNKSIPPLNPLDNEKCYMFLYNNIFYSYAMDARDLYKDCGGDKAAYKAANNDLKGVIAYNIADVDGLHTLLTAVIDYRGYRLIGQSIVPGILHREQTANVLYGSMDMGDKISGDEKFHELMLQAGKFLHIEEHEVEDTKQNKATLCAAVECKGITGTDNRKYILDLVRTTPRDTNYPGKENLMAIYRPELIESFIEFNLRLDELRRADAKAKAEKEGKEVPNMEEKKIEDFVFNTNAHTHYTVNYASEEKKKLAENRVSDLGKFLLTTMIPSLLNECAQFINAPVDGQTLVSALHNHGINLRYLGKIASISDALPSFKLLCIEEMIVRATKHVYNEYLREVELVNITSFIAHFLNSFFGGLKAKEAPSKQKKQTKNSEATNVNNKKKKGGNKTAEIQNHSSPAPVLYSSTKHNITTSTLWTKIVEGVKEHFLFPLDVTKYNVNPVRILRGFCLKVGLQLELHEYDFTLETPFSAKDIVDIFPIVKHTNPRTMEGTDLLENGQAFFSQGRYDIAFELLSEALAIFHQVYGPMHPQTATCFHILASVVFQAGDVNQAVIYQKKAVLIFERVLGIDHHDTAQAYTNLALLFHQLGQSVPALHFVRRSLYLNSLTSAGQFETGGSLSMIASILRDLEKHELSLTYFLAALESYERILGPETIFSAQLCHDIAVAYSMIDDFKKALEYEKKNYSILVKTVDENDKRLAECNIWLKQFTGKAVQMQIEAKKSGVTNIHGKSAITQGKSVLGLKPTTTLGHSNPNAEPIGTRPLNEILHYINSNDRGARSKPRATAPTSLGNSLLRGGVSRKK